MALDADRLGAALLAATDAALGDPERFRGKAITRAQMLEMRTAKYKAMAQAIIDEFKEHAVVTVADVQGGDDEASGSVT